MRADVADKSLDLGRHMHCRAIDPRAAALLAGAAKEGSRAVGARSTDVLVRVYIERVNGHDVLVRQVVTWAGPVLHTCATLLVASS